MVTARPAPSTLGTYKVAHCNVSSWNRISDNVMPPRAKAISNYQNSRYVSTESRLNGYDFGIILNQNGKVSEANYACLYILRDGVAITPPVSAGILESITREACKALLENEFGMPVVERDVDRTELYIADEVFICGTAVEVQPVVSVDRYKIGEESLVPWSPASKSFSKMRPAGRTPAILPGLNPSTELERLLPSSRYPVGGTANKGAGCCVEAGLLAPRRVRRVHGNTGTANRFGCVPVLDRFPPFQIVGRLAVGLDGGVVPVNLVEVDTVRVLQVLDDVEPETARLVPCRTLGVIQHRLHEGVFMLGLDLDGHHQCSHISSFFILNGPMFPTAPSVA